MDTPHPHLLVNRVSGLLSAEGLAFTEERTALIVCELLGCRGWNELLARWWLPGAIPADEELSRGIVAARRYGQIMVFFRAGLSHAQAVEAVHGLRPTSAVGVSLPEEFPVEGFCVRDGYYVRITRDDNHYVEYGLGRRAGGVLQVQVSLSRHRIEGEWRDAVAKAWDVLASSEEELRLSFIESRGFFRCYGGLPIQTSFGSMDLIEVISEGIVRASVSGGDDPGCYILSDKATRKMPGFSIFESHPKGYNVMAADGMGLMVPMVFRRDFTSSEISSAEEEISEDFPVTYRILKGEIATTVANYHAASFEWDEDHDPNNLPEFIMIEKLRVTDAGRNIVVMAVKTEDYLKKLSAPDGYLFVIPAAEVDENLIIDPARHRLLRADGLQIKVVRDED